MNERLDAILTEYEDLWRQAALENRNQFFGTVCGGGGVAHTGGGGGRAVCAMTIGAPTDSLVQLGEKPWACPLDGCAYEYSHYLISAMMHLNNAHHWTWDMFANKFRDALAQGMKR